jgi:hypothetical protein
MLSNSLKSCSYSLLAERIGKTLTGILHFISTAMFAPRPDPSIYWTNREVRAFQIVGLIIDSHGKLPPEVRLYGQNF